MIYGNWNKDSREFLDDIITTSKNSENILFVSGFSSLGFFSYLFKEIYLDEKSKTKNIKLILGNEISRSSYKIQDEIKRHFEENSFDYYYFAGIELLKKFIEDKNKLDKELGFSKKINLEVRIEAGERRLHAKIFVFDNHVIFGSSNLSYSGTVEQLEINKKVSKDVELGEFSKVKEIAESYWNSKTAIDYKKELLEVFYSKIEISTDFKASMHLFQDNFINGNWFKNATHRYQNDIYDKLWVHQKRSVWQALKILDRDGAVIIAEPTGSGKTKIAATVLRYLYDKYSETNSLNGNIVIVCPPNVEKEWTEEIIEKYKIAGVDIISSGVINAIDDPKHIKHLLSLKNAKILLLDEAHTYANLLTKRGKNLLFNNYTDYLIMLTATPLNKMISDYRGLLIQIGGDCLEEEHLKNLNQEVFVKSGKKYVFDLDKHQKEYYKNAISSITVRKTKEEINRFSKENKTKTLVGRYPKEITKNYNFKLSVEDEIHLNNIVKLNQSLRGFAYLNKDFYSVKDPQRELVKIKGLAKHFLIYNLRSSKAALIEHIDGTNSEHIKSLFEDNEVCKSEIKGKINDLNRLKNQVKWRFDQKWAFLWKTRQEFENIIENEINIYKEMLEECLLMSDVVSRSKIIKILKIISKNAPHFDYRKCLVFDKIPITVLYLEFIFKKEIKVRNLDCGTISIIGDNKDKLIDEFKAIFGLNKNGEYREISCVGFASNILSESVNLQGADVMFFSDTPLTPTIAEQRIGRISRMNSPYDNIYIYWPNLPDELFLNTDRLLVYRFHNITETIRANISIPLMLKEKVINKIGSKLTAEDLGLNEEKIQELMDIQTELNLNNENLSEEEQFDFEEELKTILKMGDTLEIEDSFEKLNKFFISLLGANKTTNNNYKQNLYNFITVQDGKDNEWGLFVISTNINTTPQIVFIDKKNSTQELFLDGIVDNLRRNIPSLNEVETISLIKNGVSEENFSKTMEYYTSQINNLFIKSSNILTKKHEKAFERFKDWIEILRDQASYSNNESLVVGYQEILDFLTKPNKTTPKIAQKWFNFFMEEWVKFIKNEFENNKYTPFNNSIPLYEMFSTDRMCKTFKDNSPEELYLKFIHDGDESNKKIKFKIRFAVVCFKAT